MSTFFSGSSRMEPWILSKCLICCSSDGHLPPSDRTQRFVQVLERRSPEFWNGATANISTADASGTVALHIQDGTHWIAAHLSEECQQKLRQESVHSNLPLNEFCMKGSILSLQEWNFQIGKGQPQGSPFVYVNVTKLGLMDHMTVGVFAPPQLQYILDDVSIRQYWFHGLSDDEKFRERFANNQLAEKFFTNDPLPASNNDGSNSSNINSNNVTSIIPVVGDLAALFLQQNHTELDAILRAADAERNGTAAQIANAVSVGDTSTLMQIEREDDFQDLVQHANASGDTESNQTDGNDEGANTSASNKAGRPNAANQSLQTAAVASLTTTTRPTATQLSAQSAPASAPASASASASVSVATKHTMTTVNLNISTTSAAPHSNEIVIHSTSEQQQSIVSVEQQSIASTHNDDSHSEDDATMHLGTALVDESDDATTEIIQTQPHNTQENGKQQQGLSPIEENAEETSPKDDQSVVVLATAASQDITGTNIEVRLAQIGATVPATPTPRGQTKLQSVQKELWKPLALASTAQNISTIQSPCSSVESLISPIMEAAKSCQGRTRAVVVAATNNSKAPDSASGRRTKSKTPQASSQLPPVQGTIIPPRKKKRIMNNVADEGEQPHNKNKISTRPNRSQNSSKRPRTKRNRHKKRTVQMYLASICGSSSSDSGD